MPLIDCIIYQNHIYYICTNSILHLDKKNITFLQNKLHFCKIILHFCKMNYIFLDNITFCKKKKLHILQNITFLQNTLHLITI